MVAGKREQQPTKPRREADGPGPGEAGTQGIVRDQRGQEQPADKERAQQVNRSKQAG